MTPNIKIISAGAGSGKTYRLTNELVELLKPDKKNVGPTLDGPTLGGPTLGKVRATGIIATTFTNKAAAELQERVRVKLLEEGLSTEADQITNALIGTVHSLGVKLLKRFAFEAGVSPEVAIIEEEDMQKMFNNSLAMVLSLDVIEKMEELAERLGLNKKDRVDWRTNVKRITDKCRENNFTTALIEESKQKSIEQFLRFADPVSTSSGEVINNQLAALLEQTKIQIEGNDADGTKATNTVLKKIKGFQVSLKAKGGLNWYEWAVIHKLNPGAKSRDIVADLKEFALNHESHPHFQNDIAEFIGYNFDIAINAINEYENYKKSRGLIDYTDMEALILKILKHPHVFEVLSQEIDLLLVDEFQDTSPMQLEIFLKLSSIAKHSIWVGDPKQSIYGFRGAEPDLMLAIIKELGGVKPEDIQEYSWRSREDLVNLVNVIFCEAFDKLPKDQVRLKPKRTKVDNPSDERFKQEPIQLETAIKHWNFRLDDSGRTNAQWMARSVAENLRKLLERGIYILPKDSDTPRLAEPGDVAILCRSNVACVSIAESLASAGLNAAIAREGLLKTTEIKIILACLKFVLNKYDSLSVAEILLLINNQPLEQIVENRIEYLNARETGDKIPRWSSENEIITRLNKIRYDTTELSGTEILNTVIEELDLRRVISKWGNVTQRLDNIDALRKLALQYEEGCNRLHTAASLAGLILWLNGLAKNGKDNQGAGVGKHAVNVLTYHKSKGLEWPIVICYNLENGLRDDLFGTKVIRDNEKIDINNPLANSWLRYWVNPYSDQNKSMPIIDRLNASDLKTETTQKSLEEDIRVMYVGLTRARDYLIIPTRDTDPKWLNRVCKNGDEKNNVLNAGDPDSPWIWEGNPVPLDQESIFFAKNIENTELPKLEILFQEERNGSKNHLPLDYDNEKGKHKIEILSVTDTIYSNPISLNIDSNTKTMHKLIFDLVKVKTVCSNPGVAQKRMKEILSLVPEDEKDGIEQAIPFALKYTETINKKFAPEKIIFDHPIEKMINNQIFKFKIDQILTTSTGKIIIVNSDFIGNEKQRLKEINKLLPIFQALKNLFSEKIEFYVNYLSSGTLTSLKLNFNDSQLIIDL